MSTKLTHVRMRAWLQKGGFAVLDQGLFAGANFLAKVMLARWMTADDYGAFAIAFSVFLLLAAFHAALLIEPMLVFGAGKYTAVFQHYLGFLFCGHVVLSAGVSVLLIVVAGGFAIMHQPALANAFVGLAVAAPFIMLLWLVRRSFYARFEPRWAVAGGLSYLVLMLAGLFAIFGLNVLSALAALGVMGLASLVTALGLTLRLRPRVDFAAGDRTCGLRQMSSDHWHYGRWSSPTVILNWVPTNIYFALLPLLMGLESTAAFQAAMNLILPILQAGAALSTVIVPEMARTFKQAGTPSLHRFVARARTGFVAAAVAYWLALAVLRQPIMHVLYDGRYDSQADLLVVVGLIPVANAVISIVGGSLRAMERPDRVFWSHSVGAAVTLTLGPVLLVAAGVLGALAGMVCSAVAVAASMSWSYRRLVLANQHSPFQTPLLGSVRGSHGQQQTKS